MNTTGVDAAFWGGALAVFAGGILDGTKSVGLEDPALDVEGVGG